MHMYAHTHTQHTYARYSLEGQLEFWNTGDMTLMNTAEHTMATDQEWDPTGRYVVITVSYWSQKVPTQWLMHGDYTHKPISVRTGVLKKLVY